MPFVLLAAGLNAHQQLNEDHGNLERYSSISSNVDKVLLSTWSTLTLSSSTAVINTGHRAWEYPLKDASTLHSAIGDHNGLHAALDHSGRLYMLNDVAEGPSLKLMEGEDSPSLAFLAMAGNGRVAVTHEQAPGGNLAHVGEFASLQAFSAWHKDPTNPENYPSAHHMIPGRPRQLIAGTGGFAMLMDNDNLYTWGDPRHRSLGRSTIEQDATPAHKPGLVDALAGLKLSKIAQGGWMGGAVSEDGAAYVWGSGMPGQQSIIKSLQALESGERVVLVELAADADEPDIIDLAVGDGHAALVTADGKVFIAGDNKHGQLGLGVDDAFIEEWTQVPGVEKAQQVVCGPKSTFLYIEA